VSDSRLVFITFGGMMVNLRMCIILVMFTGIALAPSEYSKKQKFNHCRDLLYTTYPNEINQTKWKRCMR